jgi:hypothetical protein
LSDLNINPDIAVAIYCGLQNLAATLVVCFETPDETKPPVSRVVVYDTILFLNIIMIMPASQNRSNCAFHCDLQRLVTTPTAKSGIKKNEET